MRPCTVGQQQIGAVDTFDGTHPAQTAEPHQWHAVGRHEPRRIVDPSQALVTLALHDAMDARHAGVSPLSAVDPALDDVDGLLEADGAHPHAQNVDSACLAHAAIRWRIVLDGHTASAVVPTDSSGLLSDVAPPWTCWWIQ